MKWRALPPQPPPELVLTELVGRYAVEVRRVRRRDGTVAYHAQCVSDIGTQYADGSFETAEAALLNAAQNLGFEPDGEGG